MKYQQLRKRLLTETAIAVALLVMLGAGTYFTSSTQDDYIARKRSMEGQVSAVTNQTNGLREKFIRLQNDQELYQLVTNLNETDMLSNSAIIVDGKLREYEYDYNLEKWTLDSAATNTQLNDSVYRRKTSQIVSKATTLSVEGVSDIDIHNLIEKVQKDFPGAVSFTGFTLKRESRLTDEALRSITKNGSFLLVSGVIKFNWYGINSLDPEEAKRQEESRKKRRRRRRR